MVKIDVSGHAELLSESVYKNTAVKCKKEALNVDLSVGKIYHYPTLMRYCFLKGIKPLGENEKTDRSCMVYYQTI